MKVMCRTEGLIPTLETAHVLAYALNHREEFRDDGYIVINFSGRGDKDLDSIMGNIYGSDAEA